MRKRAREDTQLVIGLAWCRPEDRSTLRAMFPDGDQLHASYATWLAEGERVERRMRRNGHVVKRIYIEPGVFRAWCLLRGRPVDASARSEYVSQRVRLDAPSPVPDGDARKDNFAKAFKAAGGKIDPALKLGF